MRGSAAADYPSLANRGNTMDNQNKNKNKQPTRQGRQAGALAPATAPTREGRQSGDSAPTIAPTREGRRPSATATQNTGLKNPPTPTAGSSGIGKPKTVNPSLQAYRDRRAAYRLLEKMKDIPEKEMSEKQLASREWAREVVAKAAARPRKTDAETAAKPAAKRQRSGEQSDQRAKKPNMGPSPKRPYSAVVKSHLVRAVIDRGHQDGNITPAKWMMVEMALLKQFKELLRENPGAPPQCTDAGWFQGRVKLVSCADQRSADLYEKAISKIGEVWPGSRLEAVTQENIPHRPRSKTWLPAEPSDPAEMLEFLQLSNPSLPTHDWRVAKVGEEKGGRREVVVIINNESVAPILENKGVVHYGLGSVKLLIYNSDAKTTIPQEERMTTSDANESDGGKSGVSEAANMLCRLNAAEEDELLGSSGGEAVAVADEGPADKSPPQ